jgi:quinoprotein glucose dehydrogenase
MAYRLSMLISSVLVITGLSVPVFGQTDWPTYGHDGASTRHSPLKQIDTSNVLKLVRAWTYHRTPATPSAEPAAAGACGGGGGGQIYGRSTKPR